MMSEPFFLSDCNPVATVDQRDLESVALRLMQMPEVQKARSIIATLWREAVYYRAQEQMDRFDNMIEEFMYHFALRAANSDAAYPKVLRIMQPPAFWFGRDAPGSRWGGDSPDFTYRIIPIEASGRYEIRCKPRCQNPPTVTFTLTANGAAPATLGLVDSADLHPEEDNDELIITLDSAPAEGRQNHIRTRPGEQHLMVRDAIDDWVGQAPYEMHVRRLDRPSVQPLGEGELARRAAANALESMYYAFYCTQSGNGQAPNQLRVPVSSGIFGGMTTQWGTKGNVLLADGEALIVTTNGAGARFRNIALSDFFFMSVNYWSRTGSFNTVQMAADEDGRYTFVVSHADPGIHNWLDTGGLRQLILGHRWQAFPGGQASETPTISAKLVKFDDLHTELHEGVRRIDEAGRRDQLAQREAGFMRRFIDS